MRLLICGGAGFIGSNFVRVRVRDHGDEVVVLDKLTYAGRRENLQDVEHEFVHGAIEDPRAAAEAMADVDAVVNFAAETHVDRSIAEPDAFVRTHAVGTYVLLEEARKRNLRYLQVSTDEVYGSIEEGSFTETSPLDPSSPYSATKTGADLLVSSYVHTYGVAEVGQVLHPARVRELVQHRHRVAALADPLTDEVGADEPGATADQQPHRATTALSLR